MALAISHRGPLISLAMSFMLPNPKGTSYSLATGPEVNLEPEGPFWLHAVNGGIL